MPLQPPFALAAPITQRAHVHIPKSTAPVVGNNGVACITAGTQCKATHTPVLTVVKVPPINRHLGILHHRVPRSKHPLPSSMRNGGGKTSPAGGFPRSPSSIATTDAALKLHASNRYFFTEFLSFNSCGAREDNYRMIRDKVHTIRSHSPATSQR